MTSTSALASTLTLKPVNHGRTKPKNDEKLTRDGVLMRIGSIVWYFDPYDDAKLKSAWISSINCHGPELHTDRGVLAYSRRAVWDSQAEAKKNGPPHEVYNYNRQSKAIDSTRPVTSQFATRKMA